MIAHSVTQELEDRGISRRDFLGFCASMAAVLGLPDTGRPSDCCGDRKRAARPILIWLEFQDCAGNTESFLRASHPTVADLILDTISLNYHETLMAAAGSQAEECAGADGSRQRGQIHRLGRGLHSNRRRRRLLHDRRQIRPANRARCLRRRRGDDRRRHLRGVRRHSGGASESHRCACPSPTRCPASRTSSTCRRVRPTPRTSPRSSSIT